MLGDVYIFTAPVAIGYVLIPQHAASLVELYCEWGNEEVILYGRYKVKISTFSDRGKPLP